MKKNVTLTVLFILITFIGFSQEEAHKGYEFETIINIETTPVKNQAASSTCWDYSNTSFIETEVIRQTGEKLDLSEMFTVFNTYMEKADRYVRMHGEINFGPGGAAHDIPAMFEKYGIVPESAYEGLNYGTEKNRHMEMDALLKAFLDAVIQNKNKKLTPAWKNAYKGILEAYLGKYPEQFEYNGKNYTPISFANQVVGLEYDKYLSFTSWTHQPYYKSMHVMVPDNWLFGLSYNMKLEDLTGIVDHALENGYSISWSSDWSEKGISWKKGVCYVPEKDFNDMTQEEKDAMFSGPAAERKITPELRQVDYDNYSTTDDHGLHIVGLAKDQSGKEYYIVKNSWGKGNIYDGYFYVTKAFFNFKTISIMLHEDGVAKKYMDKIK